jgi:uncharacterized protein
MRGLRLWPSAAIEARLCVAASLILAGSVAAELTVGTARAVDVTFNIKFVGQSTPFPPHQPSTYFYAEVWGEGDYAYFDRPLPPPVDVLRRGLYPPLAAIASDMAARLGRGGAYPTDLDTWLAACHAGGQAKPTPLLLRYAAGGWNALHRDLYGPLHFPLQATVLLSDPDRDFDGGEFLLVENRPRRQARGEAVRLAQGEAVLFPTWERPVRGARGWIRAEMRHGVSRIRSGERYTLGLIFHDAA